MRISDFENEDALDLLADIIEPAAVIMSDKEVVKMQNAQKPALLLASYILKNHKKSAIEIVAALHKEDPKKVRFNAVTLLKDVVDLIGDPLVRDLFTSQGQNEQEKTSGSATENTMGDGQ